MGVYEEKLRLFSDYIRELDRISPPRRPRSKQGVQALFDYYISTSSCTWKNLFDPETRQMVGFVIIGKDGLDKHPDAIRSIAEAYVRPKSRKKGLVTSCIKDYMTRHHGVFSLLVLEKNEYAKHFWDKLFREIGYEPVTLNEACVTEDLKDSVILMGYKPKDDA